MAGLADAETLEDLSVLCGTIPSGESIVRVVMPEVIERMPASRALVLHANLSPLAAVRADLAKWADEVLSRPTRAPGTVSASAGSPTRTR
jgi:hypothetical protein